MLFFETIFSKNSTKKIRLFDLDFYETIICMIHLIEI